MGGRWQREFPARPQPDPQDPEIVEAEDAFRADTIENFPRAKAEAEATEAVESPSASDTVEAAGEAATGDD